MIFHILMQADKTHEIPRLQWFLKAGTKFEMSSAAQFGDASNVNL